MTLLLQVLSVLGGVGDCELLYGCFKQELEAVGVMRVCMRSDVAAEMLSDL